MVLSASALGAQKHTLDVKVTRVIDGDTLVTIDSNRLEHKIRLAGIDAPEKNQAFGNRSRQNLSKMVAGKAARLEWTRQDRYGRIVAFLVVTEPTQCGAIPCPTEPLDVNLAQVSSGFAWHDKFYEKEQSRSDRLTYANAEAAAREARFGLWADSSPVSPADFRKGLTGGSVKKSRNNICHDPGMFTYGSVQKFESFPTLEACVASGGRLPRNVSR
jgi:endonuclease YncB( thermonuclease family)